ncbi:MAG: cytochrome C oxidase assembly protein [Pseudomonadota bacterium]
MALSRQHELHRRRQSRNLGLGIVLVAFVALIFGLTMVKVSSDDFTLPLNDRFDPEVSG